MVDPLCAEHGMEKLNQNRANVASSSCHGGGRALHFGARPTLIPFIFVALATRTAKGEDQGGGGAPTRGAPTTMDGVSKPPMLEHRSEAVTLPIPAAVRCDQRLW
jgi:hypothetical protein